MVVKPYNPGFGIDASPIRRLCKAGSLPVDPAVGVDADWSGVTFASVSQIAAVAAIQLCGKQSRARQTIEFPPSSLMGYMQRADYFRTLDIKLEEGFARHDTTTRLVPLSSIPTDEQQADPNGISVRVRRVISSHIRLSESVKGNLDLSLVEIIDNVVQHSMASSPGLACAQYYPADAYVEVCVADCGVGIPWSMGENPAYSGKSDAELLAMAFERGTGQWIGRSRIGTNEVSGGKGLSFASSLVKKIGGHIWAVSRDSAVHISSDGTEPEEGLYYPGTLVVMRVPETMEEVSEIDMYGEGSQAPSLWDCVEGQHTDSSLLW